MNKIKDQLLSEHEIKQRLQDKSIDFRNFLIKLSSPLMIPQFWHFLIYTISYESFVIFVTVVVKCYQVNIEIDL